MRYFVFYEYVSLTYPDNGLQEIGSILGKYAYSGFSVVAGRISLKRFIKKRTNLPQWPKATPGRQAREINQDGNGTQIGAEKADNNFTART
jgi:hypothetical protein